MLLSFVLGTFSCLRYTRRATALLRKDSEKGPSSFCVLRSQLFGLDTLDARGPTWFSRFSRRPAVACVAMLRALSLSLS